MYDRPIRGTAINAAIDGMIVTFAVIRRRVMEAVEVTLLIATLVAALSTTDAEWRTRIEILALARSSH